MKIFKAFLIGLLPLLALVFLCTPSWATMIMRRDLDSQVKYSGTGGVWCYGEIISATPKVNTMGWQYTEYEIKCDQILKGQDKKFKRADGAPRIQASQEAQNIKVNIVGGRNQKSVVRGAVHPEVGARGLWCIYGQSSSGMNGWCGFNQGIYEEVTGPGGGKYLEDRYGNKGLGIQKMELKKGPAPQGKALKSLKAIKEGKPLPKNDMLQVVNGLVNKHFGKQD